LLVGCTPNKTDTAVPDINSRPIADAGSDLTVTADGSASLDGRGSYDPDGDALTYHWSFEYTPDGSTLNAMEAPFSANMTVEASTTSFSLDAVGTFVIALQVHDGRVFSDPDYVIIVSDDPESVPVAAAGEDTVAGVGDTVTLNGANSYDPTGRSLTYAWTLVDAPEETALAGVADATAASTSITPDAAGVYVVNLVVNNGLSDSAADATILTVTSDNDAPTANAGLDIETGDCTNIPLDCSDSVDPDDDTLSYFWELQAKPKASVITNDDFSDRNTASPTLWTDIAGDYKVSCTVSDGEHWSVPDMVNIEVSERTDNTAPDVDAGTMVEVDAGTAECEEDMYGWDCGECDDTTFTIGSDATITDGESDPSTYLWSTEENDLEIDDTTTLQTEVIVSDTEAEEPGACTETDFTVTLTAIDCPGDSGSDTLTIRVSCCGTAETGSTKKP
jgi:hypothetical protein